MTQESSIAALESRVVVTVDGEDWRSFLQGLITQDVDTLRPGEARFGALLTPQGRLLFDLFVIGQADGAWLEVEREHRDALIARLSLYRLRAKVRIAAEDVRVFAAWGGPPGPGWIADPRLPALGWRGYALDADANASEAAYEAHRLALGVPGPADWGTEKTYPIEANFDLLNGIDFKKGCFVGQETTSRMKRRGQIKSRMASIVFEGPPPRPGSEVLAGELRAGEALSGADGRAMALLRLDRIEGAALSVDGRPVKVELPEWFAGEAAPISP